MQWKREQVQITSIPCVKGKIPMDLNYTYRIFKSILLLCNHKPFKDEATEEATRQITFGPRSPRLPFGPRRPGPPCKTHLELGENQVAAHNFLEIGGLLFRLKPCLPPGNSIPFTFCFAFHLTLSIPWLLNLHHPQQAVLLLGFVAFQQMCRLPSACCYFSLGSSCPCFGSSPGGTQHPSSFLGRVMISRYPQYLHSSFLKKSTYYFPP